MSRLIKAKVVDLEGLHIKTQEDESDAINELVSQILGWMRDDGKSIQRVNTLLMNKLVYFSMRGIRRTNPAFLISSGWYKYGPCYEQLREQEAPLNLEDYAAFNPRDKYLDEVAKVCDTEFPKFERSSEADASSSINEMYYHSYLKHVYSDLVPPDLKWLQPYYCSKHELAYLMYCFAFSEKSRNADSPHNVQKAFSDAIFAFESAICDTNYMSKVKANVVQDMALRFTPLLEPVFNDYLLSTTRPRDPAIDSIAREIACFFDDTVLLSFAYKNLLATYQSPLTLSLKSKERAFLRGADDTTDKVRRRLPEFVQNLKKHNLI